MRSLATTPGVTTRTTKNTVVSKICLRKFELDPLLTVPHSQCTNLHGFRNHRLLELRVTLRNITEGHVRTVDRIGLVLLEDLLEIRSDPVEKAIPKFRERAVLTLEGDYTSVVVGTKPLQLIRENNRGLEVPAVSYV